LFSANSRYIFNISKKTGIFTRVKMPVYRQSEPLMLWYERLFAAISPFWMMYYPVPSFRMMMRIGVVWCK
jgi:hypothetical protein